MLFGWNKVGPGCLLRHLYGGAGDNYLHLRILSSNRLDDFPQGYEIVNGQVVPVDWFAVVFNPSFPLSSLHMSIAAFPQ